MNLYNYAHLSGELLQFWECHLYNMYIYIYMVLYIYNKFIIHTHARSQY